MKHEFGEGACGEDTEDVSCGREKGAWGRRVKKKHNVHVGDCQKAYLVNKQRNELDLALSIKSTGFIYPSPQNYPLRC